MFLKLYILAYVICIIDLLLPVKVVIKSANKSQRNILHNFFVFIEVIIVFLLVTSNRSGDILNYRNTYLYKNNQISMRESLYTLLNYFFYNMGWQFYHFRAFLTFLTMLLGYITLEKYEVNISFFMLFYLPITLFWDSMLFRNSLCLWLLLYASQFAISKDKRDKFCFIILILIMAQIHTSFLFYGLFIFFFVEKLQSNLRKILLLLAIVISLFTLANGNKIPFYKIILSWILSEGDTRLNLYNTTGRLGFLYPLIVHSITFGVLEYLSSKLRAQNTVNSDFAFVNWVRNLNYMTFLIIPFQMMNVVFYRFFENAFYFNIIAYCIVLKYECKYEGAYNDRCINIMSITIVMLLWLFYNTHVYTTVEWIMDPVLKNGIMFWQ